MRVVKGVETRALFASFDTPVCRISIELGLVRSIRRIGIRLTSKNRTLTSESPRRIRFVGNPWRLPSVVQCFGSFFHYFAVVDGAPEGLGFSSGGVLMERAWVLAGASQERVHERVVEQTVAFFFVLPIKEAIVEVAEQRVDVPVPPKRREIVEVIQLVPVERIKGRVADQMAGIPVPLVMEEIVSVLQELVKLVSQERVQQRTVEHALVPQILEETVEVVLAPTERVQQRIGEQIVELLIPQIVEENVEVVRLVPQECVQRIGEQMVDVLIPQILDEEIAEAVQFTPQRLQWRSVQQNVRIVVPPVMEAISAVCEQIVDVPVSVVDVRDIVVLPAKEEMWKLCRSNNMSVDKNES